MRRFKTRGSGDENEPVRPVRAYDMCSLRFLWLFVLKNMKKRAHVVVLLRYFLFSSIDSSEEGVFKPPLEELKDLSSFSPTRRVFSSVSPMGEACPWLSLMGGGLGSSCKAWSCINTKDTSYIPGLQLFITSVSNLYIALCIYLLKIWGLTLTMRR